MNFKGIARILVYESPERQKKSLSRIRRWADANGQDGDEIAARVRVAVEEIRKTDKCDRFEIT